MSLYAAVILLGQVGNNMELAVPPATADQPAAVRFADQSESPAPPFRPTAETPARPGVRTAAIDSASPSQLPAVRTEPAAAIAESQVTGTPPAANSQTLQVAATMMEEILVLDEQSQQNQRRVRLVEALSRISDPVLQSTAIRAYWELAQSIANSRYAADKMRVLSEVSPPAAETDRALLAEALAAAEAEEAAAQDALLSAQYGLLRVTGMSLEDALPWPADVPLIAPYRTQFSMIFANQPAPLSLRQIHQSLPGKLRLIEKRVSAMAAAESATDALLESYKGGRTPLVQLLPTIERLDRSRRAFLNAVVDYNHQIAEYSLAVVGSGVGPETLVATLIKIPAVNNSLVDIPRDVRQAGASTAARDGVQSR